MIVEGKDGKSGAHARYSPSDITSQECTLKLMELGNVKNLEERTRRYNNICARFRPAFRHFFYERFIAPSVRFITID